MKTLKKLLGLGYFTAALAVLFGMQAFAYLDPGTLSYVISMIAGLFIAGGAALAIFRRKIKLFFQNLGKKKSAEETQTTEEVGGEFDPMADVVDPMAEDK